MHLPPLAALDRSVAKTNDQAIGKAYYPPSMRLGLLISYYATGVFFCRRIETLSD
jgi:hypothetical protein